ncbi:MAG: transcription antitermination factor NusB, partial [Synechococcus sp. ELA619]
MAAGAYADGALERELQRQPLTGQDRALATELAYGAIRQRRLLDAWLDQLGKVPAERQPPKLRWLLHLGLYQLLASDRVPASAAVSTCVELAKRGGLARLAPVVNGLLRSFLRQQEAGGGLVLSTDPALALAQRQSLPDWLAQALLTWLPAPQAEAFAGACNQPPSLDLRCNPLRGSREQLLAEMRKFSNDDANQLEDTFKRNAGRIACMLIEPIMGNCLGINAEPEYLRAARELCDKHGVIL